jgi:hypothetical protein
MNDEIAASVFSLRMLPSAAVAIAESNNAKHQLQLSNAEEAQRIAVGSRAHDRLGADIAAPTWTIFNDELLTQPLRQPLPDEPRSNVGRAGWSERHDQVHRPRRIGLRPCDARDGRQRGSACCEMQELAAGKFHSEPPSRFTSLDHVGDGLQRERNRQAECLRRLEIDHQLELGRLQNREVGGFLALEDTIDVSRPFRVLLQPPFADS